MCGIVGYVGKKNATPFLLDGLSALEYRGYDSAGMYVEGAGFVKRAGKVRELRDSVPQGFSGSTGIAHTRWATHGPPTEVNAHPHADNRETVWVVHNGIIENYAELKKELVTQGSTFRSDTDTEVLAELIGRAHASGVSLPDAVKDSLTKVRGTYGLLVASKNEPGTLVAARLGSPLMLGIGEDGYYLASDATPVLKHTRDVIYLDDGEMVIVTKSGYDVRGAGHAAVTKKVETLEWDVEAIQKKGHEHFMLKEIMEVPDVIENSIRGRLVPSEGNAKLGGLEDVLAKLKKSRRIIITGCGSAYYAGLVGDLLIEELSGIPVEVEVASELRYKRATMNPEDTVLIAVSQSGETLDTLEAIKEAKRHGVLTLGVVNVVGSTIARETDAGVYNHAGPEIGVASTKGFISQITVLSLIALMLGREDGFSPSSGMTFVEELAKLPAQAREILSRKGEIEKIAKKYAQYEDALYLGRKFQCPIAYEGALKLKEVSYIHAEGYGAGEMKHGPLALIDPGFPSIVLVPKDSMYEKTKANIAELKARGGRVLAITTDDARDEIAGIADDVISVPKTHEALLPILTTIPLHLLSYYVTKERGLPIDMPRNLAKSVTVE
jgi:glucosamine--fructose-6-phosphate aminotransferase (isomerizing)